MGTRLSSGRSCDIKPHGARCMPRALELGGERGVAGQERNICADLQLQGTVMKSGRLFLFVALAVAAVAGASARPTSRKLNAFAVTANLDPLDTFDAFTDASGRTFVRVVDSPVLAEEEEEGTVFGEIFKGIATALTGGIIGGGEILEVVVEDDEHHTTTVEGGEATTAEATASHGAAAEATASHGAAAHGGAAEGKRRM
eukprot:evm.model.scf_1570.4 EVM.evm.TU.scf_1570.4   scf_1570:32374-35919(+)